MQTPITVHSTAAGSDKVYQLLIVPVAGGFNVLYANARRTATLTPNPKKPKNAKPLTQAAAETLAADLAQEKRTGSSKYHTLGLCSVCAGEVIAESVATVAPAATVTAPTVNASCQLLTPLEGIDNCRTLADFLRVSGRLIAHQDYCAERKFDGIRILLYVDAAGNVTAYNRSEEARGISSAVIREAQAFKLSGPLMFDGESIGDQYHIFDLLEMRGVDLRSLSFDDRKAQLTALLNLRKGSAVKLHPDHSPLQQTHTAYTPEEKKALLEKMFAEKKEGVVFKKRTAPYRTGRAADLYKVKFVAEASFIITEVNPKGKNSVTLGIINAAGTIVCAGHTTIRPCFAKDVKVGAIIDVRYLYARRSSSRVVQAVGQRVRTDIPVTDCHISQLKFKENE